MVSPADRYQRVIVDFQHMEDEDLDAMFEAIVNAVMEIVDRECDGELPCPRDWNIIVRDVSDEYNNPT